MRLRSSVRPSALNQSGLSLAVAGQIARSMPYHTLLYSVCDPLTVLFQYSAEIDPNTGLPPHLERPLTDWFDLLKPAIAEPEADWLVEIFDGGELEPEDLSGNLIVQLGLATEDLNRRWYQANTGQLLTDIQRQIQHPALRWMSATLDGRVEATGAVFEAKFMLPWSFSEEAAAEKYMPQLQHNMWVVAARSAVLSVITGGGKWVEIATHADPLYQHLIVTAE
jgi:hypothetical protein